MDGFSVSLLEFVISSSTTCSSSEKDIKGFIESFELELLLSVLLSKECGLLFVWMWKWVVLLDSKELNGFYVYEKYNLLD